jgi:hypothetical protein
VPLLAAAKIHEHVAHPDHCDGAVVIGDDSDDVVTLVENLRDLRWKFAAGNI